MGSQTLLLAEEQFLRYATQLQEDCGASDELIVEQLYKCIPAYMKDEIMEYGTVAYNVDDFVRLFRSYFTPNLSAFYTTFTNQQGNVHLQQAHESVRDFMQKSFYKHLLKTRGCASPGVPSHQLQPDTILAPARAEKFSATTLARGSPRHRDPRADEPRLELAKNLA